MRMLCTSSRGTSFRPPCRQSRGARPPVLQRRRRRRGEEARPSFHPRRCRRSRRRTQGSRGRVPRATPRRPETGASAAAPARTRTRKTPSWPPPPRRSPPPGGRSAARCAGTAPPWRTQLAHLRQRRTSCRWRSAGASPGWSAQTGAGRRRRPGRWRSPLHRLEMGAACPQWRTEAAGRRGRTARKTSPWT